ncbi:MAG: biotin--[acetyl-CoA-carboxylase] ligase [Deltaproteobacteria bacterium]|nr:biotin--[acetyl-CoA-carboxylase] ligase [Deltaproteobacteria bacterium]
MEKETVKKEVVKNPEAFNLDILASALKQSLFGKNIVFRDTIGSTNVFLKRLAQEGACEGTMVIADEQSAGLGRLGREWFSKKGENLLFSVLLRPQLLPSKLFVLTMIIALAGIDAVQDITGLNAMIKWPNDIYIGEKKLGGILSEFSVIQGVVQHLVLGMGLNVNWKPEMERTLLYPTSSIFTESHKKVSREEILINLLKRLEGSYYEVGRDMEHTEGFYKKWNEKSLILGKTVVIETGKERIEGEAAGIDRDGALTLITTGGDERKFLCGDVSVKMNLSEEKKF